MKVNHLSELLDQEIEKNGKLNLSLEQSILISEMAKVNEQSLLDLKQSLDSLFAILAKYGINPEKAMSKYVGEQK